MAGRYFVSSFSTDTPLPACQGGRPGWQAPTTITGARQGRQGKSRKRRKFFGKGRPSCSEECTSPRTARRSRRTDCMPAGARPEGEVFRPAYHGEKGFLQTGQRTFLAGKAPRI